MTNDSTDLVKREVAVGSKGIILATMQDMWRFADCIWQSGIAPSTYRNTQCVVIAIQYGAELGMGPMQSLQCIAIINNRPALYGDRALAMVLSSPVCDYVRESYEGEMGTDEFCAVCISKRKDDEQPVRSTFSVEDARTAELMGKDTYRHYLKRMLRYRARGFNLRDNFPDVLAGIYIVEEAMDIPREPPLRAEEAVELPKRGEVIDASYTVDDKLIDGSLPPLHRVAAKVRELVPDVDVPTMDKIMRKTAGRAMEQPADDFTKDEAWTDEVADKVIEMLNDFGVDPEWIGKGEAE